LLLILPVDWQKATSLSGKRRRAEAGESQQGDRKQAAVLQHRPGKTRHLNHRIDLQSVFLFESNLLLIPNRDNPEENDSRLREEM
jgi:hypothetical protein